MSLIGLNPSVFGERKMTKLIQNESLIIFAPEKDHFFFAHSFIHHGFKNRDDGFQFLNHLQTKNPVVFRVNFENQISETSNEQIHLHNLFFMEVFELIDYQVLNLEELQKKLTPKTYILEHFTPLLSNKEVCDHITRIKKKISKGYFYQVNYSIPFKGKLKSSSVLDKIKLTELFLNMRRDFSGNFHAFLPLINQNQKMKYLLSFSPELFISINQQEIATSPIKGTIANGRESELLLSQKENAELSMIVDLLRNDLNAVCNGPVSVSEHRKLLTLKNLTHTYSTITGKTEKPLGEILQSMLPGGSISGCPKKESVLTIYELEPYAREHYTGVLGVYHRGSCLSSIVIRSAIFEDNGDFYYNAGSGIVYDSVAENEFEEIILKSKSLMTNSVFDAK